MDFSKIPKIMIIVITIEMRSMMTVTMMIMISIILMISVKIPSLAWQATGYIYGSASPLLNKGQDIHTVAKDKDGDGNDDDSE